MTPATGLIANHFNNSTLYSLSQQRVGDLPPGVALCENMTMGNSA
ncbi:MAG TPA: hypothetical protein VK971_01070 [Thiohalobacter sp.]|nr:hypothetical protein [Thiohalobacter sp.]